MKKIEDKDAEAYFLCEHCVKLRKSKQYCGVCKQIWHHSNGGSWVHAEYANISSEWGKKVTWSVGVRELSLIRLAIGVLNLAIVLPQPKLALDILEVLVGTRAGYSRANQYYASYPTGINLLTDSEAIVHFRALERPKEDEFCLEL